MFRIVACAASAAIVVAPGLARAELLTNGTLEDPAIHSSNLATGWTLVEPSLDAMAMPVDSASFVNFNNHTPGGERSLWFRSFEGGLGNDAPFSVDAHLYQDVPGVPGRVYELSAWFLYEMGYSGLDPTVGTQTLLALEFLDAGDGVIGSSVLDIDTLQSGDSVWRQYSVNGVSPAGTVSIRARASMINGVLADTNPQSAFVDDLSLIPTPGAGAALGLGGLLALRRRR